MAAAKRKPRKRKASPPREHEPQAPSEAGLTRGQPVHTRALLRHLAVTERAMVRTQQAPERLVLICSGAQVSERRARRLIRAVNMLWHYRAQAFGTPGKARTKLLPQAQALYERALQSGNLTAALGALRLQADLCGLSKTDVLAVPLADHHVAGNLAPDTAEVATRVMDRLLAYGLAKGGNGHAPTNGHGPS